MVNFATKIRGHKSKDRRQETWRYETLRLEMVTGLPISLQWYRNPILNIAPSQ